MKVIGIDIGTTSICGVVLDAESGKVFKSKTVNSQAFIDTPHEWEKIQDVNKIVTITSQILSSFFAEFQEDVSAIGVTGQMHGIVYVDVDGHAVSPLYTWQDNRGEQPYNETETYAAYLSRQTGYFLATGFGIVTHFYNLKNNLVPEKAAVFCTIHDYVAMRLAGLTKPIVEASDAASFGLFDIKARAFDVKTLEKVGISSTFLPELAKNSCIGTYEGTSVYVAIGDNQASFLGATNGNLNAMLVNVGTGSQFSAYSKEYILCPGLETRSFPGGGYLIVGASLCGGRAYALLERFFASVTEAVTGEAPDSCYEAMNRLLSNGNRSDDLPTVVPLFQGTRLAPHLRGSITGLSSDNFTPQHLVQAMVEGIVTELYEMYCCYLTAGGAPAVLIGSGNGLRKNKAMQESFASKFRQTLIMSACAEEAATGAALFARRNQESVS